LRLESNEKFFGRISLFVPHLPKVSMITKTKAFPFFEWI
jgi:hypothetical protein